MAQALYYSSTSVSMKLTTGIGATDTTCNLDATTGLPTSYPFKLLLDWGAATQEVVHCTGVSGLTATIVRGQDSTTAQSHGLNATVVHGVSAREFNDVQAHLVASQAIHGLAAGSSVVGTTDTQTISNKTLIAPTIGDFSNAVHGHGAASGGALLQANTHGTPDTDSATTALHHTLGTGANQAAAGTHLHTGTYQPVGSYASTTHTHAESDVTNLASDLAGKQPAGSYCTNVGDAGRVVSGQVSVGLSGGVGTATISYSGFTGVPQVLAVCLGGSGSGYVSINNPTSTSSDLVVQNSTGASRLVNYIVIGN